MRRFADCFGLVILLACLLSPAGRPAHAQDERSTGQTLYVSIYSHVYTGPKLRPFQLTAMLVARNTDPEHPITITAADYHNTKGALVQRYVKEPVTVKPLEAVHLSIEEHDERGGAGASFIVQWKSATPVNPPIIESLMLGTRSGQGISFRCPGKIITGYHR